MKFSYLKNYCKKNTKFKEKLIELLELGRNEKLAMARASDDDEADMYYDEAEQLEEIINYYK